LGVYLENHIDNIAQIRNVSGLVCFPCAHSSASSTPQNLLSLSRQEKKRLPLLQPSHTGKVSSRRSPCFASASLPQNRHRIASTGHRAGRVGGYSCTCSTKNHRGSFWHSNCWFPAADLLALPLPVLVVECFCRGNHHSELIERDISS